ncbi:type II secretion system F family protein [Azospirillum sp. ST 5-10]|uniref:type II secretion system F family protein n=1 Tax=unclassified Azospirillum TaxID=2630922 RepID=UPI003F4A82F7
MDATTGLGTVATPPVLLLVLVFATTVLAVLGGAALAARPRPRRRAVVPEVAAAAEAPSLRRGGASLQRLLAPVARRLPGEVEGRRSPLRLRLMRAGCYGTGAAATYQAARIALALAGAVAAGLLLPLTLEAVSGPALLLGVLAGAATGAMLPVLWLCERISERTRAVQDAFPDALDLLLVCVEAGLGVDAAMARVGDELLGVHPVMAEQFLMVGLELRAGRSREDALRGFAERIGLDEVTGFVNLLVQSDRLGTSMAEALRVGAEEMRARRMARAEEKAHQLPAKLAVPMVLFLLPGLVTVVLLPALIQFLRFMGPAGF